MFVLEESVTLWRERITRSGAIHDEELAELESHLRDQIEDLTGRGLREEEAFLVASRRLGDTSELVREYAKVYPGRVWGERLFWMLAGYLFIGLLLRAGWTAGQFGGTAFTLTGMLNARQAGMLAPVLSLWCVGLFVGLLLVGPIRAALVRGLHRMTARHPLAFVLIFLIGILALQAAALGQRVVMARMLGAAQLGEFLTPQAYGQIAFAVAFPLILLTSLVLLRRRVSPLRGGD
jgi:hypothetical protein